MILLAYKYIRLLLVIILAVTPVSLAYASQNTHCDTQSSEYKAQPISASPVHANHQQKHCAHATENGCQCNLGGCHCATASHFFLQSLIKSFQFLLRHNLPVDTYPADKTDVYISLTLRPPIVIFA